MLSSCQCSFPCIIWINSTNGIYMQRWWWVKCYKFFNENICNNTVYQSLWFWRGIPCKLTPHFCVDMSSCPGCHLVLVLLLMLILLVQWSEGIKPHFSWWQGSPFNWVGILCIRAEDASLSVNLTWRGTYLLCPPFGLANCDSVPWVFVAVIQSTIWWHLWAMMLNPSAKCMWLHLTFTPATHYL